MIAPASLRLRARPRIRLRIRLPACLPGVLGALALGALALGVTVASAAALPEAAREANAAAGRSLIVQSTTSTHNSGLYGYLLPLFEADTGIGVKVVAVGTGQALDNARRCDGDVLVVHAPEAEKRFVAEGHGTERRALMHNDFVLLGPAGDPAGIRGMTDAAAALARIAATNAPPPAASPDAPSGEAPRREGGREASASPFVSRGDDSGTHKKELALWEAAGTDPREASGTWYREVGAGMGAAINIAVNMNAYTLADRATWVSHGNPGDHVIAVEGDRALLNPYSVVPVNPERCPNVDGEGARIFADWLTSERGQAAIAAFEVNGTRLFMPDAIPDAGEGG